MTFEQFLKVNQSKLVGYYLLAEWFAARTRIETPVPPSTLTDDELEQLRARLDECMPVSSLMVDLWDWDVHFEHDLEARLRPR